MSLDAHMLCVAMMLCQPFKKKSSTHFSVEWVAIMNEVAEGYTFNWAKMLSNNLTKEIVDYKTLKSKGKPAPPFLTPFPLMNWSWTPAEPIDFFTASYGRRKPKFYFMKSVTI